ncbi:MAG: GC-type dockerin domain-anchored protein [Planctomycetota bacterium]
MPCARSAVLLASVAAGTASAQLRFPAQNVDIIQPPVSAVEGALEDNDDFRLWRSRTGHTLAAAVEVDILGDGFASPVPAPLPPEGVIPAGTVVDVIEIHFDSVGTARVNRRADMAFEREILGVIYTDARLDATDATLGHPSTVYPFGLQYRGMIVDNEGNDQLAVGLGPNRPVLNFTIISEVEVQLDMIRLLVEPEPQPCSPADLAPPFGVISQADVNEFVNLFFANDPQVAAFAAPFNVVSQADVNAFVDLFFAGCGE